MHENSHYNKHLQPYAYRLRNNMTKAEACLWKYVLKGKKMKGFQFRRQRPVGKYIADFMCPKLMLIIEVDGVTHQFHHIQMKDIVREQELVAMGYQVIRFQDEEVLNNIKQVTWTIERVIDNIILESPPPSLRDTSASGG